MELPPGFRFHPTDEELITHYLYPKVLYSCFCARAIGEVDLNKCEPWDLPWRAKMGEKERYLFCVRDRKYPTGLRTNRATEGGYWKATGKDREIHRGRSLVGMKKTLVFYRGRAPNGGKSNWVMHEFRLEGKFPHSLPKSAQKEWVICRIFQKSEVGKKVHISDLPPLIETAESSHVNCFSNLVEDRKSETDIIQTPNASFVASSSSSSSLNPKIPSPFRSIFSSKISLPPSFSSPISPAMGNLAYPASLSMAGQSVLRTLGENHGLNWDNWDVKQSDGGGEFSDGTDISSAVSNREIARRDSVASVATFDLDCLWNYSD